MGISLRRRLSSARDWSVPSKTQTSNDELSRETLLRYREKLQPIFSDEFFDKLEIIDGSKDLEDHISRFLLRHSLKFPIVTMANLHVQPGDPRFTVWLFISAYFPVLAACIAPLANLISLIGLIEHWQIDPATGISIPDERPALVLNILSFLFGIIGNYSLLMNFSGRIHYLLAQCITITCFVLATICLLVAVLLANWKIHRDLLATSEGFWLAIFTIVMYALCTVILGVNVIGWKLHKYRPKFNLDKTQRSLMSHTIVFSVWLAVGSIVSANLIPKLSYGSSLYYCTGSMLTIGLGDIVPLSVGAKVFSLLFSLVGVLILGLIISVLRQVILYSAGPSLFWHHVEKRRIALVHKSEKENTLDATTPEDFDAMRKIRLKVSRRQKTRMLAISLFIFISFWLLGALVFQSLEKWSYFNAVYFCLVCLLTIGYGDFHPVTPLGRVFFVVWAIAAVPLMTILILNLGDTLFETSDRLYFFTSRLFHLSTYKRIFMGKSYTADVDKSHERAIGLPQAVKNEAVEAEVVEDQETHPTTPASCEWKPRADKQQLMDVRLSEQMNLTFGIHESLGLLQQIVADVIDLPKKQYDFDEWTKHLRNLETPNYDAEGFWIGDHSPLRLPLQEPKYLLLKSLGKLDKDLKKLLELQNKAFLCQVKKTVEHEKRPESSTSRDKSEHNVS